MLLHSQVRGEGALSKKRVGDGSSEDERKEGYKLRSLRKERTAGKHQDTATWKRQHTAVGATPYLDPPSTGPACEQTWRARCPR